MIKRVRIQGYKSLHDLDLKLGKFCVLFGPNASGKSNFLDALQLMSGLIKSPTLNDAFNPRTAALHWSPSPFRQEG